MGRKYHSTNTFNGHDSNTICAVTGFKVKKSEVIKRWDGVYVIAAAWHPRHPQDRPIIPMAQTTYTNILTEDLSTDPVDAFEII